jgi:Family of unknown function (DUF6252)
MKKVIFILLTAFFLMSCKKGSDDFTSYIKGKLDGVAFECTSNIWATPGKAGNKIISFRGDWLSNSIRFYLDGQGSNITTGSYNFQTGIERNAVVYENNDGYSAGYFCGGFAPCTFYGSGKITIVELSKKYIKGSFEFVAEASPPSTRISKTVSEGEFYIKRN